MIPAISSCKSQLVSKNIPPRSFLPPVETASHAPCVRLTMARHWSRLADGSSEPIQSSGVKDELVWWSWPPRSVDVGQRKPAPSSANSPRPRPDQCLVFWQGGPARLGSTVGRSLCPCLTAAPLLVLTAMCLALPPSILIAATCHPRSSEG